MLMAKTDLYDTGTDRGTHAIEASEKYAKEHGLPNYEQVGKIKCHSLNKVITDNFFAGRSSPHNWVQLSCGSNARKYDNLLYLLL